MSANRKSPAFSFYPDSWISGTALMDRITKSMYIDLLGHIWLHGCLTLDQCRKVLFIVPGSDEDALLACLLADKFVEVDGQYTNGRLEDERRKQRARAAAGSKGGNKKASNASSKTPSKPPSKTVSKPPSKKLGSDSDSDSDSDSITDTDSGSIQQPVGGSSANRAEDGVHLPPVIAELWAKWRCVVEVEKGRVNEIAMREILQKLTSYGERKAAAYLRGWIDQQRFLPRWEMKLEPYYVDAPETDKPRRSYAPRKAVGA